MFDLPVINPENVSRDFIDVFGGYNHNLRIGDNEFFDMKNMSSLYYPMIATRPRRGDVPSGIVGKDKVVGMLYQSAFYYVTAVYGSNHTFIEPLTLHKYEGNTHTVIKQFDLTECVSYQNRSLLLMGAYMIIMPDKLYVNVEDPTDSGSIEAEVRTAANEVTVQPCLADGTVIDINFVGSECPVDYSDGYVWVDTSVEPASVKRYDAENHVWMPVVNQYVSIKANTSQISVDFNEGDGININGTGTDFDGTSVLRSKPDNKTVVISGHFKDERIIVFPLIVQTSNISVKVFCEKNVTQNQFAGKEFIIGTDRFTCDSNSEASAYKNYENRDLNVSSIQASYFTTISKKQSAPPDQIWKTIKVARHENEWFYDSVDSEDTLYVRVGNSDISSRNVYLYRHHSSGSGTLTEQDDQISLQYVGDGTDPLESITGSTSTWIIPAGTKLYPVRLGDSQGLYETQINFNHSVNVHDSICIDPEYAVGVATPVTFSRLMPKMDFIVESNNRLWGCRYGENNDGDFVNEIYACKLGDFKNWQVYEGISTDSYAASCGTDGAWTGAVNYLGYPVFFKENYIHTVYGSYPAQYQINGVAARGVKRDCSKSIAILNEVLYYLSPDGVCAYNGSLPTNISAAFGDQMYYYAAACAYKDKYYIRVCDKNYENPLLFVYDSKRSMWHKEDSLDVVEFCPTNDDIFFTFENWKLRSLFGSGSVDTDAIQWYIETGIYGLSQIDSKYISKLNIRLSLEKGANVIISIQYDNSGKWERLCNIVQQNINPFTLPIKPRRCDHFQLRLEGIGGVKVYSISKNIEQGSDK